MIQTTLDGNTVQAKSGELVIDLLKRNDEKVPSLIETSGRSSMPMLT